MEEKKQDYILIMFGCHYWDKLIEGDFNSRNGQMLKYLNKNENITKIIYVNPYFYSYTFLSLIKYFIVNLSKSLFSPILSIKRVPNYPKITVINILNLKRVFIFKKSFFCLLKNILAKKTSQEGDVLLWLYNPAEYEIFDLFPKAKKIFDTIDNWIEMDLKRQIYPWYDKSKMVAGYREICSRKDVLIISNGNAMTKFYSEIRGGKTNILEIPNGIDTELFSFRKFEKAAIPQELINCKHPIIGYVGVIQERFDVELFQYLLKNNPDYTFVVVGYLLPFRDFKFHINAPNLIFTGFKRYSEIPHYIYNFNVCIVPHKVDNMTLYMNPMKIYEYLAMGKPVVTTPVSGIDELAQYCKIAVDYDSFNRMLRESVKLDNRHVSDKILRNLSWNQKISSILAHCCPIYV